MYFNNISNHIINNCNIFHNDFDHPSYNTMVHINKYFRLTDLSKNTLPCDTWFYAKYKRLPFQDNTTSYVFFCHNDNSNFYRYYLFSFFSFYYLFIFSLIIILLLFCCFCNISRVWKNWSFKTYIQEIYTKHEIFLKVLENLRKSEAKNAKDLRIILQTFWGTNLYEKKSKCAFWMS